MQTQGYVDTRRFRSTAIAHLDARPYANHAMVILKFDWMRTKARDWQERDRLRARIHADCKLITQFKIKFIDEFAPKAFDELLVYTSWQNAYHGHDPIKYPPKQDYEKSWLLDQYEIGLDLIHEKYGVRNEHQWRSWYLLIPKVETAMVEWVLQNKPYFVKVIKRI